MEIVFQGYYDKGTLFKAISLANKPSKRSTIFRIGITVLFIGIYIVYFLSLASKESLSTYELLRSGRHLFSLVFIAIFLLQPYISSYFTALKIWKDPLMQEPLSGYLSSQGVAYRSSSGTEKIISWASFAKKQTTDTLLVLLTADGVVSFFPRSFFKTDDDWRRAKQLVDFNVVEAK